MTSTTATSAGELRLALDDISVRDNVRELAARTSRTLRSRSRCAACWSR
ncbi:MAG: hypothetical protein LC790_16175 [Actinobacteria bacterium]|nr:hypothetical protein [Actinomycetota bacterium]